MASRTPSRVNLMFTPSLITARLESTQRNLSQNLTIDTLKSRSIGGAQVVLSHALP